MSQEFESRCTITRDDKTKTTTLQLSGDDQFIEQFLPKLIKEFNLMSNDSRTLQSYSDQTGYISKQMKSFDENTVPDYFKTGIKENEDGTKRYKCRYECQNCGNKANRYIKKGTKTIKCHECDYIMHPESVGLEAIDQDDYQNFYTAGKATPFIKRGGY